MKPGGAQPERRTPMRVLGGVALVAGATLALQVLVTRIFAAILYYHFGFLAISLALLGVGAGAIAVYLRPELVQRGALEAALARWSLAFAASVAVAALVLVRLDYALDDGVTLGFLLAFGAACTVAAVPFTCAGVAIALAVRGYTADIGRVYAFDLAGAAAGAAAVVPLLWIVDAPMLTVALAALGVGAAALFAPLGARERRWTAGAAVAAAVLVALAAATSLFEMPVRGGLQPVAERWTPLNRVLGFAPPQGVANGLVTYDRNVGEVIRFDGRKLPGWRELQEGPPSVGYELAPDGRALVIGGGGGRDVLAALSTGRRSVDVVELNRGIKEVVDEDLAELSGRPYSLPGVRTTIGDGRSTLASSDELYAHIQLGFVDTFSGSSAQAFALTENNLYTVEAFEEYLDHLAPGGVLNVSRPVRHNGDEALRATVLALETLRRRGVDDPERHVAVVMGDYRLFLTRFAYGTVLVKREPFTAAELGRLRGLAAARTEGIAFAPGGPYRPQWRGLAGTSDLDAFCRSYPIDVCAPTDDKPFFFNMKRVGDLGGRSTADALNLPDPLLVLAVTLGVVLALAVAAFVLPLALARTRGRPTVGSLLYFAAIGCGFLLLEVVLIQRFVLFLGFPTYALSVVLFALLLFTGAGSLLSTRHRGHPRRALIVALGAACALIAAGSFGLQPLLRAMIELPFAGRVAVAIALLAPAGLALGMAMPLGLQRLAALHPGAVAWAWGINGIASVAASVLAVAVAIQFGFAVATLLALACYLAALAHVLFGRWPAGAEGGDEPEAAGRVALAGSAQASRSAV
jgi:hypothetical protein